MCLQPKLSFSDYTKHMSLSLFQSTSLVSLYHSWSNDCSVNFSVDYFQIQTALTIMTMEMVGITTVCDTFLIRFMTSILVTTESISGWEFSSCISPQAKCKLGLGLIPTVLNLLSVMQCIA